MNRLLLLIVASVGIGRAQWGGSSSSPFARGGGGLSAQDSSPFMASGLPKGLYGSAGGFGDEGGSSKFVAGGDRFGAPSFSRSPFGGSPSSSSFVNRPSSSGFYESVNNRRPSSFGGIESRGGAGAGGGSPFAPSAAGGSASGSFNGLDTFALGVGRSGGQANGDSMGSSYEREENPQMQRLHGLITSQQRARGGAAASSPWSDLPVANAQFGFQSSQQRQPQQRSPYGTFSAFTQPQNREVQGGRQLTAFAAQQRQERYGFEGRQPEPSFGGYNRFGERQLSGAWAREDTFYDPVEREARLKAQSIVARSMRGMYNGERGMEFRDVVRMARERLNNDYNDSVEMLLMRVMRAANNCEGSRVTAQAIANMPPLSLRIMQFAFGDMGLPALDTHNLQFFKSELVRGYDLNVDCKQELLN